MQYLKRSLIGITVLTGFAMLSGCETIKGAGKDITNAAEAVDRAF